jgi:hypothetical protein
MTSHIGGLTDEDLASLPQDYLYGISGRGWVAECAKCFQRSEPGSNQAMHDWVARHAEYRLCPAKIEPGSD